MTTPRFRPPQQTRSQETLDKILDAAEHVLDEKSFTEATLAEIMERAGVTVGAFYRRFPDKDALLHLLDERFFQELRQHADTILDQHRWGDAPVAAILQELGRVAAEVYRSRRGLLRSLFLRARVDPVIQASARQVNAVFYERLRAVLLAAGRREQVRHPDPEKAVALGFIMFVGALRETAIFGEIWPEHERLTRDDLGGELARQFTAYLGAEPLPIRAH